MKRHWKKAALLVVAIFVGIQFVPVDRANPPVEADLAAPTELTEVLRTACYDCHSNETRWRWYSYVAPVSWLVAHDVDEARAELCFSDWGLMEERERNEMREEIWEEVEEGEMPLLIYRLVHPSARLSPEQRGVLREWTHSTERGG
jgi:hypothetical protein